MRRWRDLYGRLPSSYDWSRTHARRRGEEAIDCLAAGDWPAPSVITDVFGSWAAAHAAVGATQAATPDRGDRHDAPNRPWCRV